MKKVYLISYKPTMYQALNTGFTYDLQLEVIWFGGWFKTERHTTYEIPDHQPLSAYTLHWDNLIINRKPLK